MSDVELAQLRAEIEKMKILDVVKIPKGLAILADVHPNTINQNLKKRPINSYRMLGSQCISYQGAQDWLRGIEPDCEG